MPEEKYSINDVCHLVDSEGLGYAIQDYLRADNIEDPELSKLWAEAKATLDKIEIFLDENNV